MNQDLVARFYEVSEGMRKIMLKNHNFGDMSKSEFSMMHLIKIYENELDVITTAMLSEQLHISKPAVSQMINVLEKKQFVKREIHKNDRRLISISLTELGNKKLEEKKENFLKSVITILDRIGEEESEIFISIMEKYFKILKELSDQNNK